MKTLFYLFVTWGMTTYSFGQTINYDITKDEPIEPRISINLDLFNMDLNSGIPNYRLDNYSINFGLNGYVKIAGPLEIDFSLRKAWLTFGKLGFKEYAGNTELNGGVNFWLSKREVVKNTKVVLKQTETRTATENTTTTTYIMIPAKHSKRFGLRGGLYHKSGPFNFEYYVGEDNPNPSGIEETNISSFGIYGGFVFRDLTNIIIKDDTYGRSMNSRGRDIYFEALFVPINRFKDLNDDKANVSETVRNFRTTSPVGFRLGYRLFQTEKKAFTGKKFGISGQGEFGYKPYQGWFLGGGFGITLVKH